MGAIRRLRMADAFMANDEFYRQGRVLDWAENHVLPVLAEMPAMPGNSFFGMDFGRSGDLSVIWVLRERQDLTLYTPLLVELRNVPHDQQKQILFYIVDRLPRFQRGALDARGNGHYLAESAKLRYGAGTEEVMLSSKWYLESMPRLKARFEDKTIEIPKDADILADLRAVRMDKGIAKVPDDARSKSGDGGYRHGDAAVALALAVYASAAAVEIFGYEPVKTAEKRGDRYRVKATKGFKNFRWG